MVVDAYSLESLLEALQTIEDACDEAVAEDPYADRSDDMIDWTSLPNYGGAEPNDTWAVWSWDADSLLVGECMPFSIKPRNGR